MRILKRSLVASLIMVMFVAAPVWAQETGSITGTVTDPDGAPLPGVAVTISGQQIPTSTVYTQANGVYRFPYLPPSSSYVVTLGLEGFKTIIQEGLIVRVGGNTQINVLMELSTIEETVTVTGSSPIVDVKSTSLGTNMTEEYMQSIPSARDPWVMLEHTTGMQINKTNVGGSEGGQQSSFSANGSNMNDSVWTYDGAEITDMAATGASPMYYDFDAFEEISISTGGNDPSIATGGIRINFVTKRGGNSWRGSTRFYLTDGGLQSDTVADRDGTLTGNFASGELYPGYIGNAINNIKDYGAELGGPVVRNRFFVWGSYGKQDIKQFVGSSPDNTQLKNIHGKGNLHLGDSFVLNYTYVKAQKTKQGRGASATRPPPTTFNQGGPSGFHTVKAQYTLSDNNYVEVSYNNTPLGFFLEPQGGRDVQPSYDFATGLWGNSYYFYDTDRPLTNVRVDGNSYIAGANVDHEIKYGYSYRSAGTASIWGAAGGAIAIFSEGVAAEAWLISDSIDNYEGKRNSFYAGDTISAGRMTFNVGLRYDNQTSQGLASEVPASAISPLVFPANSFPGSEKGTWNSLSPRFGMTYDLTGDSKTILRLNAARYYSQMAAWQFQRTNTTSGREVDLSWTDLNGNGQVDGGEAGDVLWISGGWDPANPTAPSPNIVDDTTAPWTNEVIIGIEKEINRSLAIGGNFIYKKNSNFTWNIRDGEENNAFWTQVTQSTSAGDIQVYQPTGSRSIANHYGQRNGYNTQYTGIELFLNKRFADKWMGNASFVWANPKANWTSGTGYTDPTNIQETNGQISASGSRTGSYWGASRWYIKMSGMYSLPAGFNVSSFMQFREGNIISNVIRSNNRAFGAGRVSRMTAPFGTTRLPTFWTVDLRAEKTFDLSDRGRVHLIVDVFNAFNQDTILATSNQINSSVYGRIREVQAGRTIRFGFRAVLR
jgi:hypothetical protein